MASGEVEAQKRDLNILLNLLDGRLKISYPLFRAFDMIEAGQKAGGYALKILADDADFQDRAGTADCREELPSHADLVDCLLTSGVISYENSEEVGRRIGHRRSNYSGKVLFSPDTNVLYHNYLSSSGLLVPDDVAIVDTVKDEIEASMNHKYSGSEIREIRDSVECNRELVGQLSNRRKKKSRKAAYLAKREYKEFLGRTIPSVEDGSHDSEQNDRVIARSLRDYGRESGVQTVLLTADTQMADICEMEGVERLYLKYPVSYEVDACPHANLVKLVFDLSVTFGLVKLNSVIILGEFGGKGPDEPDALKLKFLDGGLGNAFCKHQKICRGLSALEIEG